MIRRTTFSVLFLFSILPISLYAQDTYVASEIRNLVGRLNWNKTIQPTSNEIQGSPYLNDEFQLGEVYYDGKYKISQLPLRYNLYNDEIEYKEKNAIMAFADPNNIDKVVIEDQVFIYIKHGKKSEVSGFVQMWHDKLPTVLTKMKIDFLNQEEAKPYVEPKPDRFERGYSKHYLMKCLHEIERIVSIKKLIKSLGAHQAELSAFAKKEKISSSDPEELAMLLNYYHELEQDL